MLIKFIAQVNIKNRYNYKVHLYHIFLYRYFQASLIYKNTHVSLSSPFHYKLVKQSLALPIFCISTGYMYIEKKDWRDYIRMLQHGFFCVNFKKITKLSIWL